MGCFPSKNKRKKKELKNTKQRSIYESLAWPDQSKGEGSECSLMHSLLAREKVLKTKGGKFIDCLVAGGKYRIIGRKISSGSFGEVFLAVKVGNETKLLAIKIEAFDTNDSQLAHEFRMYQRFKDTVGIPNGYWYGKDSVSKHTMLVMDILGPVLEHIFDKCNKKFSVKTVLLLIDRFIPILQNLHDSHFMHRDLKPANIVMGHRDGPDKNKVFGIDFALSKNIEIVKRKTIDLWRLSIEEWVEQECMLQ